MKWPGRGIGAEKGRRGAGGGLVRYKPELEDNFHSELQVEGFAGAYAGSSEEISLRVGHEPKPGTRGTVVGDGVSGAALPQRERSCGKVDPIKQVEELEPELRLDTLGDWEVLKDREIDIGVARTVNLVSPQSAVTGGWHSERVRVHPLHAGLGELVTDTGIGIADQIETEPRLVRRLSAMESHQAVYLPSMR